MPPKAPTASEQKSIDKLQEVSPFFIMFTLVKMFHSEERSHFPVELVLALCWEESQFQNIKQHDGGPAVGFGQLERDGRQTANRHLTRNPNVGEGFFTPLAILASAAVSVSAVSHCLAGLFPGSGRSVHATLLNYAGVEKRPQNAAKVAGWEACAPRLKKALRDYEGGPAVPNAAGIESALRLCWNFPASGPVYDHIHEHLFWRPW
jgi:hypothetical protein